MLGFISLAIGVGLVFLLIRWLGKSGVTFRAPQLPTGIGQYLWWIVGGIFAIILIVACFNFIPDLIRGTNGDETNNQGTSINWPFWFALILFVGISLYGLRYSSSGSVWFTRVAGACIFLVLGYYGYMFYSYGTEGAPAKIEEQISKGIRRAGDKTTMSEQVPLKKVDQRMDRGLFAYRVQWDTTNPDGTIPKDVPSKAILIPNYCTIHAPTFDGATRHHVEISEDGKNWYVPTTQRTRANYIRYTIHEDGVKIFEVFMSPGC